MFTGIITGVGQIAQVAPMGETAAHGSREPTNGAGSAHQRRTGITGVGTGAAGDIGNGIIPGVIPGVIPGSADRARAASQARNRKAKPVVWW